MVSSHLALSMLARFARDESHDADEIRAFVHQDAAEYSAHLGPAFVASLATCDDDRIRAFVASEIRDAREARRVSKSVERARDAQASADVLSVTLTRDAYGRIDLDAPSILASCLTSAGASLLVHVDDYAIAIPMGRLIDTARVVGDAERLSTVRAWIETSTNERDHRGPVLHVRWTNASGREAGYRWRAERVDPMARGGRYLCATGSPIDVHAGDVTMHAPRGLAAPRDVACGALAHPDAAESLAASLGWLPGAANDRSEVTHAAL